MKYWVCVVGHRDGGTTIFKAMTRTVLLDKVHIYVLGHWDADRMGIPTHEPQEDVDKFFEVWEGAEVVFLKDLAEII